MDSGIYYLDPDGIGIGMQAIEVRTVANNFVFKSLLMHTVVED